MKSTLVVCLSALLLVVPTLEATSSLAQKLIVRRQAGEIEKESSANINTNINNGNQNAMQPARLYPDLPGAGAPYPYAGPQGAFQPNFHGAPTPFVPFSPQLTPSQLSDLQRRMQPPRPMSSSERLQSQTFTSGLGRRLLNMIGLGQGDQEAAMNETSANGMPQIDPTVRALQNATVLQQLNGGVQSIYGSLSKMYNSTVQQQLNMLQERFKKESENSTNPWQQRMSEQVPMFFKNMATKVGQAQENLNRIWEQMLAQAKSNGSTPAGLERSAAAAGQAAPQSGFFSSFDRFVNPNGFDGSGNFFDQFGRSLGFGQQQPAAVGGQGQDLGSQLVSFWHNQVQPQIGMVRGQMMRVWRDLTASGVFTPEPTIMRSRNQFNGLGSAPGGENASASSSELVDEILKEVDMNNSEYTILDTNSTNDQQQQSPQQSNLSNQMQNRLIAMQRELNQLWGGLTSSLQNAIGNVRNTLNPRPAPQFGPMTPMASEANKQEIDPAENEISGKVKDLSKLQREADTVHDTLRQQQQQQQQQQRGFGDRFRSFFNNVDIPNEFNQLPGRFSDSMNRFGTAVGDLWNQIPRRWDNMMERMSPQSDMARARLTAAKSTTSTTTEKSTDSETTTASS